MKTQPIETQQDAAESVAARASSRQAPGSNVRLLERGGAAPAALEQAAAPAQPAAVQPATAAATPATITPATTTQSAAEAEATPGYDPLIAVAEQIARSRPAPPPAEPHHVEARVAVAEANARPAEAAALASDAASAAAPAPASGQRSVLVGHGVSLHVTAHVPGKLIIDGVVSGDIEAEDIVVRAGGLLEGRITCRRAEISGSFKGQMFVSDRLTVRAGGRMSGEVAYGNSVQAEVGAVLQGCFSQSEQGLRQLGVQPLRPRGVEEVARETALADGRSSIVGRVLGAIGMA